MTYSIKQLADLGGVSVRTLHYYDEIGLLKPEAVRENGYRTYGQREVMRLQQILFFRELDFPLEEIREIMNAPGFDVLRALEEHERLLRMEERRIRNLMQTVQKTIVSLKGGDTMKNDDLFVSFTDDELKRQKEEAKKRWGHTEAWRQSEERTRGWKREDYEKAAREGFEWARRMGALMQEGAKPGDAKVQEMIKRHYESLKKFYDPTYEMYKGLGQMYVSDPRFGTNYERHAKGLAAYVRDAMVIFADNHLKSR